MAYTTAQINRIGNLLVYITSELGPTPKTKLLKLIYIIEEEYVKKTGVTFTELSYTFLPLGPVSTFVNNQIDKKREPMARFVKVEKTASATLIKPATLFSEDEFSPFDLEIVDDVLATFGKKTASQLIDYTHRENGLWKKIKDQYDGNPPAKTHFNLLVLLNDINVSDELRNVANEEKAFVNYITDEA
jgi:uncharacterized phage-associated protein